MRVKYKICEYKNGHGKIYYVVSKSESWGLFWRDHGKSDFWGIAWHRYEFTNKQWALDMIRDLKAEQLEVYKKVKCEVIK